MKSDAVIEGFDVVEDGSASLGEAPEAPMVNQLVFEAAKERLNKGVVVTVAFSTHGSSEAMLGEQLTVSGAGELGSTIRVDDEVLRVATLFSAGDF